MKKHLKIQLEVVKTYTRPSNDRKWWYSFKDG